MCARVYVYVCVCVRVCVCARCCTSVLPNTRKSTHPHTAKRLCMRFAGNGIGTYGAKQLLKSLENNTTLTSLDLRGSVCLCVCVCVCVCARACVCKCPHELENQFAYTAKRLCLRFVGNGIGDEGAKRLVKTLENNATLTSLDLRGTRLGLRSVWFAGNGIEGATFR